LFFGLFVIFGMFWKFPICFHFCWHVWQFFGFLLNFLDFAFLSFLFFDLFAIFSMFWIFSIFVFSFFFVCPAIFLFLKALAFFGNFGNVWFFENVFKIYSTYIQNLFKIYVNSKAKKNKKSNIRKFQKIIEILWIHRISMNS